MKKIILIFCVLQLSFSLVVSQVKVEVSAADFLEMSPSVKANGMGQIGVTVVGNRSYFSNPAILGLSCVDKQVSASSFLNWSKVEYSSKFYQRSVSLPIYHRQVGDADYYIGAAYYRTENNGGKFSDSYYSRGVIEGTARTFIWDNNSDNFVIGLARTGIIDVALGFTVKTISEKVHQYSTSGIGYDIGGIVRYNTKKILSNDRYLYFIPAIGYSKRNFGPAMKYIENSYSLPTSNTIGLSVEIGLQNEYTDNQKGTIFEVTPAIEFEKQPFDESLNRLGAELSFYEVINFRIGKISSNKYSESETTFGFTLSTSRFGKFLKLMSAYEKEYNNGIFDLFFNKVNIEYNYASYDKLFTTDTQNYHELVIYYQL